MLNCTDMNCYIDDIKITFHEYKLVNCIRQDMITSTVAHTV